MTKAKIPKGVQEGDPGGASGQVGPKTPQATPGVEQKSGQVPTGAGGGGQVTPKTPPPGAGPQLAEKDELDAKQRLALWLGGNFINNNGKNRSAIPKVDKAMRACVSANGWPAADPAETIARGKYVLSQFSNGVLISDLDKNNMPGSGQAKKQEFFNGKEPCKTINPDEAVAFDVAV